MFHVVHENVERLIGYSDQFGTLMHLGEVGAKHHSEMSRVLESEFDIPFQQSRCSVDILTSLGVAQGLCEHREAFQCNRLKDSPTVGEVVIRSLMAHTGGSSHLPKGEAVGTMCCDVIDSCPQNGRSQVGGRHGARIRSDLDTVK